MTKTTAHLRNMAMQAERDLDWTLAADCWKSAIAAYPTNNGGLCKADLARMEKRAKSCRATAREQAAEALDDFNYVGSRHHY
jgi:hypothetical protein